MRKLIDGSQSAVRLDELLSHEGHRSEPPRPGYRDVFEERRAHHHGQLALDLPIDHLLIRLDTGRSTVPRQASPRGLGPIKHLTTLRAGIQTLLDAEKEAAKIVAKARECTSEERGCVATGGTDDRGLGIQIGSSGSRMREGRRPRRSRR